MNTCGSRDTLARLLANDLPGDEADALRQHLSGCTHCQVELDRLSDHAELRRWAAGPLRSAAPAPEPVPSRLLDQLRKTPDDTRPDLRSAEAPLPTAGCLPEWVGPYRLLEELGSGGMGIVYKAHDPELNRVVAVKVLRAERSDPAARERFLREARATAGLRHDHVVTVYAVGCPEDGPPYLVMEYVAGPTLADRIFRGPLDPKEAAEVCAGAADGLAAAHRAGLVHRDVKPANLLLDAASGRARIVDFGLVRLREHPGGVTRDGTIPGTPEYMSPEQIRTPDRLDERSDVYSLGVTLYEALTGEVPFRGSPHMVLQQVLEDEPTPPRRLSDRVPRDLETICLKAMAKEPAGRYAGALALRDDLRRWLAGEPIQARPVGRLERLGRWCRRKPALAALWAALLFVLVAGFAGVTWQWLRADRLRKEADEQRRRAEDGFREALGTVHEFLTVIGDSKLLNRPGLEPLRRDLLERARRYYQRFLDERAGDSVVVRSELAFALDRLAYVTSQLGPPAEALPLAQRATVLLEELADEQPDDAGHRLRVGESYRRLGDVRAAAGDPTGSAREYRKAIAVLEEMARTEPGNAPYRSALGATWNNLGNTLATLGRPQEALGAFESAIRHQKQAVAAAPGTEHYQDFLGRHHVGLGRSQIALGQFDEALKSMQQARGIAARLAEADPEDTAHQETLCQLDHDVGVLHFQAGRPAEAGRSWQEAMRGWELLVREHPRVLPFRLGLAQTANGLGDWHRSHLGQPAEACGFFERARAEVEEVMQRDPRHPDHHSLLGATLNNLGLAQQNLGRFEGALASYRKAVEHQRISFGKAPEVAMYRRYLSNHYVNLAHLSRALSLPTEAAEASLQRAKLWPDDPDQLFTIAGELAQCILLVPAEEDGQRRTHADEAVRLLRQAVARGFRDRQRLKTEKALEPLRAREEYQRLVAELE